MRRDLSRFFVARCPPAAWMRRGLFVYCRQPFGKGATDDIRGTAGATGEVQQAPDSGADVNGSGDVRGGDGAGLYIFDQQTNLGQRLLLN